MYNDYDEVPRRSKGKIVGLFALGAIVLGGYMVVKGIVAHRAGL